MTLSRQISRARLPLTSLLHAAATVLLAADLSGCSSITSLTPATMQPARTGVSGNVHGGQQGISGAVVQLYAVNTTSLQGASTPLIGSTVTTDASGFFNITGLYTCPAGSLVYIVAAGGDPGAGFNAAAVLMAALGPCDQLKVTTFISINELTTVASVYALAPFMADVSHVGSTADNANGLTQAFKNVNSLVDTASGRVPGSALPVNGTAPVTQMITLANILAACINTNGGGTPCTTLFNNSLSPAGALPTETIGATLNISRSPAANTTALFNLVPPGSPFQPSLTTAPSDWTLALRFAGGGITAPHGLAADSSGNIWVANEGGFSVTKLNPAGAPLSGDSGYSGGGLLAPQGIAIDRAGNAWIANTGGNSVVKLSSSGAVLSGAAGFTSATAGPADIALDGSGNAWIANFQGNTVAKLDPNGAVLVAPTTAGSLISAPTSVALDPAGTLWVSSSAAGTLVRLHGDGTALDASGLTDQYLQGPAQVALTSTGQAWVASPGTASLTSFDSTGTALAASPFYNSGLRIPTAVAVDGSNAVWVADSTSSGSLSHLSPTGTPLSSPAGFGALATPLGVAIDAAGSVWTSNSGDDTVSEFIGVAAPVALPLAARTP